MNRKSAKGFTLYETILAVAVFSLFAVGVLKSLDATLHFYQQAQLQTLLRQKAHNCLDEMRAINPLMVNETIPADDNGVALQKYCEPMEIRNGSNILTGYYRIKVVASFKNNSTPPLEEQMIVYAP